MDSKLKYFDASKNSAYSMGSILKKTELFLDALGPMYNRTLRESSCYKKPLHSLSFTTIVRIHRSVSHRFSHHATSNMGKQTTLIVLDILMTVSFHCRNEPDTKIKFLAIIFSFILFRPSKFNVRSLSLLRTLLYKTVYQRPSGLTSWYGLFNNSLQHIVLHFP